MSPRCRSSLVLSRVLDRLRGGDDGAGTDIDWDDPAMRVGGDGPTRRYVCPERGGRIESTGAGQSQCPACDTVFEDVSTAESAVCPDCGATIESFAFVPETRRDTEFADCDACEYRWESDPRYSRI
ncbi:MAG: hypothetical protein ABEJ82_06495 [Haloplanus sp.]